MKIPEARLTFAIHFQFHAHSTVLLLRPRPLHALSIPTSHAQIISRTLLTTAGLLKPQSCICLFILFILSYITFFFCCSMALVRSSQIKSKMSLLKIIICTLNCVGQNKMSVYKTVCVNCTKYTVNSRQSLLIAIYIP